MTRFIPTGDHPGAFGAIRKHDVHTGVDLYFKEDDDLSVRPFEAGTIVSMGYFTGAILNMPWWNDTHYVTILGKSGFILYGEINLSHKIRIGKWVDTDDLLGYIKPVLPQNKVRPDIPHHSNYMLHVELYKEWRGWVVWELGQPKPEQLLDPTTYLQDYYTGISKFLGKCFVRDV